jgi:phage gpG-like protein
MIVLLRLRRARGVLVDHPGPVFDNEGAAEVTCLAHQTEEPGGRYTDREMRNTGEVLSLMKYYTSHGTKPYCDNAAATGSDEAWAQLHVDLGGTTATGPSVLP